MRSQKLSRLSWVALCHGWAFAGVVGILCAFVAAVGVSAGCWAVMLAAGLMSAAINRIAEGLRLRRLADLERSYEVRL